MKAKELKEMLHHVPDDYEVDVAGATGISVMIVDKRIEDSEKCCTLFLMTYDEADVKIMEAE